MIDRKPCSDIAKVVNKLHQESVRTCLAILKRPIPSVPYYRIEKLEYQCVDCKYYFNFGFSNYCNGVNKE